MLLQSSSEVMFTKHKSNRCIDSVFKRIKASLNKPNQRTTDKGTFGIIDNTFHFTNEYRTEI